MTDYQEFKEKIFENRPGVKAVYDSMATQQALTTIFYKYMIDNNMTQTELGEFLGLKQQNISRLMTGNINVTLEWATKHLNKLGYKFEIVPLEGE